MEKADVKLLTNTEISSMLLDDSLGEFDDVNSIRHQVYLEKKRREEEKEQKKIERNQENFEKQIKSIEKTTKNLIERFDKIIELLSFIVDRPYQAGFWAIVVGVIAAVLVNLLTHWLTGLIFPVNTVSVL